jgi:cell division protein FtsW (lipid II flippase)
MGVLALGFLGLNLLLSEELFGAKNWIIVAGHSLQPSEFVKIAYVFAGAATLDRLLRRRNLLLFIAFSATCVGALALMGDFGTALVFFVCFLVISYMRSGSFATVALALSGAGVAGMLVLAVKPYLAKRFATWGAAWADPLGGGYQQVRAMSAAASGGLFGHGAGNGWLQGIVAADTDLVFGVVCEELGLIVGLCCILAVILLGFFAVRNASAGRSAFYVIAACAAVTILMAQMALNVFGSLDILPFTGVTFPFVSKGGSSLISCWVMLAYVKAADTRRNASFALSHMGKKTKARKEGAG